MLASVADVGDGLTLAQRTLRTSVMLALDEVEAKAAAAFADTHPLVRADRERAIREIADLVMRTAMAKGRVEMRR